MQKNVFLPLKQFVAVNYLYTDGREALTSLEFFNKLTYL